MCSCGHRVCLHLRFARKWRAFTVRKSFLFVEIVQTRFAFYAIDLACCYFCVKVFLFDLWMKSKTTVRWSFAVIAVVIVLILSSCGRKKFSARKIDFISTFLFGEYTTNNSPVHFLLYSSKQSWMWGYPFALIFYPIFDILLWYRFLFHFISIIDYPHLFPKKPIMFWLKSSYQSGAEIMYDDRRTSWAIDNRRCMICYSFSDWAIN